MENLLQEYLEKYFSKYPNTGTQLQNSIKVLLNQLEPDNAIDVLAEKVSTPPEELAQWLRSNIAKAQATTFAEPEDNENVLEEEEPQRSKKPKSASTSPKSGFFGRIRERVSKLFQRRKTEDREERPKKRSRLMVGAIVIAAIAILVAVLWFFGSSNYIEPLPSFAQPSQTQPEQRTQPEMLLPPEAPQELSPVDLASASWFGPTQKIIIFIILLLGFANYRDAKQRGQISDFLATIFCLVLVFLAKFLASLLKGPLEWLNFNDIQLLFFTSVVCMAIAIAVIWQTSRQGGVDYSPLADFIASIAGLALLSGTLGALGTVLNTPKAPILPFAQVQIFFTLKQYSQIWMSLVVYVLLAVATLIYAGEILRLSKNLSAIEIVGTMATSFVGLVAYPLIRVFVGWNPVQTFISALALAMITGIVAVRAGAVSPLTTGETRTSNPVTIPWDKLAFQFVFGLLIITLLGRV